MANSLYFLDFYIPNEGEPDTALEVAVLRLSPADKRPGVFLHSFLRPENPARIRWISLARDGFTKERFCSQGGKDLPSLREVQTANFLKNKAVVCMNPVTEPCSSWLKDARRVIGLTELWQNCFASEDRLSGLTRLEDMLEAAALPAVTEDHGHKYTPLLLRLHAKVALWCYLHAKLPAGKAQENADTFAAQSSDFWPLPEPDAAVTTALQQASDLSSLDDSCVQKLFSPALPDYLNWYQMQVYVSDWVFKRRARGEVKLPSVTFRMDFVNYVFSRVLHLNMQIWVLIYYSIYDHRTDYAREIALHKGVFADIPYAAREDFAVFLLNHLHEFLSLPQKRSLLSVIIRESLKKMGRDSFEAFDFEETCRKKRKHKTAVHCHSSCPEGSSFRCFREIRAEDRAVVLYRSYTISGDPEERDICTEYVRTLWAQFLQEVSNPFCQVWMQKELQPFIQCITGFAWQDLQRECRSDDTESLIEHRELLREVMQQEIQPWLRTLQQTFVQIIRDINSRPDAQYHKGFNFQGISVEVTAAGKSRSSFFSRLFHF